MTRRLSISAEWRYRATVPFARDVPAEQREQIAARVARVPVKFTNTLSRETLYCTPDSVDVSADELVAEFTLGRGGDYTPADVLGALSGTLAEWHREEAPIDVAEPTRDGGEATLDLLTTSTLVDAGDREEGAGAYYLLAYPDEPLSETAVEAVEHHTGADVMAGRGWLAVVGRPNPHGLYRDDGEDVLRDVVDELPTERVPDTDLDERGFWPTRELGTLAADSGEARATLARRAEQQTPHTLEDDVADSESEVGA